MPAASSGRISYPGVECSLNEALLEKTSLETTSNRHGGRKSSNRSFLLSVGVAITFPGRGRLLASSRVPLCVLRYLGAANSNVGIRRAAHLRLRKAPVLR